MNEQMEQVIKEAVSDADLSLSDIPRIDLYLDQILNLVSEKNEEGSDRYKERILTKTMINNYSKEGAILPLKGKKYNRQQVLQILFIYSLKNTLSIGEIKRIFDATYEIESFGEKEFEELYRDYLTMKERSREETARIAEGVTEKLSLDLSRDEDYMRLILAVVSLSAYLKSLAETMIDVRFPLPEEEEESSEKTKKKKSEKTFEKAEALSEKAGKVAEKAEKVAAKAEKVAAKAEKIAEKESARAEKKKTKKKSSSEV